ncbi:Adhesion G protein-coupled receptor B3 [Anthophora plagiata]
MHSSKMRSKVGNFSLLFYLYHLTFVGSSISTEIPCGGHLTAPRGVIQTPNFPRSFHVPIKCRWVIDVSDIPATNSSIVVYLTQVYVYKGLSFTEYAYYESESMNFGAALIKEITEGNVFEYKYFRTFRPFLVVEFELDRLEGNHVRVLNNLLDVYGFNVTYQMTEDVPNSDSCSVQNCSYTGNCLVSGDYVNFWCDCFEGFSGKNCNEGPLCFDERQKPVCQNGGTCKQIGAETMSCSCADGYVGRNCEIHLLDTTDGECGIENCIIQCPREEEERQPCACRNGTKIYNNRSRYECRIKLSNVTFLRAGLIAQHGSVESYIGKQLAKYLRNSNISSMEDLQILSVTPTSEVTFHFFGNSEDGDKIRESLNRLVQRRRLSEISLESTHFTFQQKPALKLQSLKLNQGNEHEVDLGDQFILSCTAQGSYYINFTWYKDNMRVNMNKATREIWYRNVPNDGSDLHTSLLTIEKATLLDAGQYTCQIVDWGVQQCKSIYVDIRDEPDVKVMPMSATIDKGSSIQLTCTTPNMPNIGIGFGWTKNRALLKLEPGSEVWEDLYPAGSILKITNAQKSAIYTCNVADKSMSVRVEVVNRTLIPICPREKSWGLMWPDTAPGSESLLECPQQFVGKKVSRLCSMKDATTPEWQTPDFFSCWYEPLVSHYNRFKSLTLGYQNTTGSETIFALWEYLRSRSLPLYPGEGDRILSTLAEIERYQHNMQPSDLHASTEPLIRIINRILNDENSILSEQKVLLLLQITQRSLIHWSKMATDPYKHLPLSSLVIDIQELQQHSGDSITHSLQIPIKDSVYPKWYDSKATVRLWKKRQRGVKFNNTISVIVIVYKNVSHFLPATYVNELDDGTDLEFRINSRLVTVAVPAFSLDKHNKIWVDLQMKHVQNQSNTWNVSCGLLDGTGFWDLNSCIANTLPGDASTHCLCPSTGTFAVFLTARAVRVVLAKREQTTFIVILGCGSCLAQCLFSSLILGALWWKNRSWLNFLKLQCCGALVGAMTLFIYAVHNHLPESSYAIVATSLEAFLLIGMSAPISEALIIYAGLTQVRPSQHFQPTVIAVITGVPVLAVLSTELTHKSTGWRHESWWLIFGSGVYTIFITCATMMFLIFALLYLGILHKAHALVEENFMKKEAIEARLRMLHRAAVVICGVIAMETSSILYINSTSIIFHYIFASLSSVLGFVVIMVYIMNGDLAIIDLILTKLRWKRDMEEEITSEPIKVCSKSGVEVENDTAPPPSSLSIGESYLEARGIAAGSIDMREFVNESSSSYSKTSVPVAGRFLPEIRIDHTDDINLENYSTSPRKYQESIAFDHSVFSTRASHCLNDPYNAGECCSFREYGKYREPQGQIFIAHNPSPENSSKVLCSADVESRLSGMPDVTLAVKNDVELLTTTELKSREHVNIIPDIANTTERKQPDGEEKAPEIVITNCEATTSGMLDRIAHDLDYLLNRTHSTDGT